MKHMRVEVVVAGVEGAWQAASRRAGASLRMRSVRQTPAHRTDKLAEIVCSNFKSDEHGTASFLLKEEFEAVR